MMTQPGITKDWLGEMNALVASLEPEGEAAWPIYRDIIVADFGFESLEDPDVSALRERISELNEFKKHPRPVEDDWNSPRFDPHREMLSMAGGVFTKLDEAATKPRLGKGYARVGSPIGGERDPTARITGLDIKLPELGELRRLAVLNEFRARAAAAQGDWGGFVTATRSGFALGDHVARAGALIEELVGVSIVALRLNLVRVELVERSVPPEACRAIEESIERSLRNRSWFANALEVELMVIVSGLDTVFGTNGYAGSNIWEYSPETRSFEMNAWWRRIPNAYMITQRTKGDAIELLTGEFDRLRGGLSLAPERIIGFVRSFEDSSYGDDPVATMANFYMPAMVTAFRNNLVLEREIKATRIMLRLETRHAETGVWPADLSAPEFADLNMCPLTGQPFNYALTPDDEHGRPYTLTPPRTPWPAANDWDFTSPREAFVPEEEPPGDPDVDF